MSVKWVLSKPFEESIKITDLLCKLGAFRRGNPLDPEASLVNSQKTEVCVGFFYYLLAFYITFQVMAVADVSPGNQNPLCTF